MSIPVSAARDKLFPLIQEVNENSSSVLITSKNGNAVLISQSEYERMIETLYLFSTPANAKALLAGLEEAKRGKGLVFTSLDEMDKHFTGTVKKKGTARRNPKKVVGKRRVKARVK